MPQTPAYVTPKLIEWARRRYNLTPEAAAKRINVRSITADRLRAWEKNEGHPSLPQAREIAGKLYVPFGVLFLSSPPSIELPLPDLRTVSGEPIGEPSPEFIDLLHDVLRKRDWIRDYRTLSEAEVLPFVGRFRLTADPAKVAADVAETLKIDDEMRRQAGSWEGFLREFTARSEQAGVIVLRSGVVGMNNRRKLDVEEFRGFAISDDLAPVVFINGGDAKGAMIFTLAHELAHIWLGQSGISNPNDTVPPGEQVNSVDRLCDKIAVELLVPNDDFAIRWDISHSIFENAQALASHYRVSAITVLRRALETEVINAAEFREAYAEIKAESRPPAGDGGNFHYNLLARNSASLTTALIVAAETGLMSQHDAASLLNVRVKTLGSVRDHLLSREMLGG